MKYVKLTKKPRLKYPRLIAGWPGMGNVGLGAVYYFRRKMKATKFGILDTSAVTVPEAVVIEKGLVGLPPPPASCFYYSKNPNLIIFESDTQLNGETGVSIMQELLDLAERFQVREIYTAAAFPTSMTYSQPSLVYGVANSAALRRTLVKVGVRLMKGGQISGMNGLLLGYAGRRNIEGACFLATLPSYAINLPNPKASAAIVRSFSRIIGANVDMKELEHEVHAAEEKMYSLEKRIREVFSAIEEPLEGVDLVRDTVPKRLLQKIERLFTEAKADKKKAYLLKEELDRWHLYDLYEDRFLDLFKQSQ